MFATRTYRARLGLLLSAFLLVPAAAGAGKTRFTSVEEALRQGISAYNGGFFEIAIPALEHAASENRFLAQYYLARIHGDNSSNHTDHAKAYVLYQRLSDEYADVDPDHDQRAPFVAKSLTALARYVRSGLPEVGLVADAQRAAEYLHHAALFFNDEDAQFELAKMQLTGEGVQADTAQAKHWLATLSQKGHAGAQAFLADLYWRGRYMDQDQVRALALITVATANAPPQERVWIDDIYQNIYCGSSKGVRKQATGLVADWRTRYGRKTEHRDRSGLAMLSASPVRTCADGEAVATAEDATMAADAAKPAPPIAGKAEMQGFLKGSTEGGLRDMGGALAPAKPATGDGR